MDSWHTRAHTFITSAHTLRGQRSERKNKPRRWLMEAYTRNETNTTMLIIKVIALYPLCVYDMMADAGRDAKTGDVDVGDVVAKP